jgi:hypothetical protein
MGLLDKARDSQIKPASSPVEKDSLGKDFSLFLKRLDSQPISLDYGSQVFKILSDVFGIEKGALFFEFDENRNFISLCSNGYDITTNNRLRLNYSFFEDDKIASFLSKRDPFILEEPPPILNDIFSTREFGMIEEMYFIPIVLQGKLFSLLMITAWKEFLPEDWATVFAMAADRISLPLSKSRMALIRDRVQYGENQEVDYKQLLQESLSGNTDSGYYIIKLNVTSLIEALLKEQDGFKAANVKDEIISVFKTMSGIDADIIELPNNFILLVQRKKKIADIDLYLFQLSASLPLLYTSLSSAPDLQSQVFEYENDTTIETILKDLF